ncbi:hypothetical protein [Novosphingobium sp.]|uniref:hypothetical protein n=1 Tax=Novosphingobium sp. TaxID=1874826 RepID=UPI0025EE3FEF|nr:hypothetical protein [Novosphingobium sp.]
MGYFLDFGIKPADWSSQPSGKMVRMRRGWRYSSGRSLNAMLHPTTSAQSASATISVCDVVPAARVRGAAARMATTTDATELADSTCSAPATCARAVATVMPGVAKPAMRARRVSKNRIEGSDRGSDALRPWAKTHRKRERFPGRH